MPSGSAAVLLMLGLGPLLEPLLEESEQARVSPLMHEAAPFEGGFAPPPEEDNGVPLVTSLAEVLAAAPATVELERRTWVRHRVRPRERITQIAARYGVRLHDVIADNRLDPNEVYAKKYRSLRIRARRIPPPRVKVRYVAQAGEEWGDIAAKFRVEQLDLRAWNWQRRKVWDGREMVIWADPGAPYTMHPDQGPQIPDAFGVPTGGRSVGRPQRGKLEGGVLLPQSELYTRRKSTNGLWGSSHTIETIHRAFAHFRHDYGYEGEVVIGAISRKNGRTFHPHKSHQSGRDIDIRMPLLPGVPPHEGEPNPDEIDWHATWGLIRSFAQTGQVAVIFVQVDLHRRLYEAARAMGESREQVRELLQWPSWQSRARPIVRHSRGHDSHMHVRIKCGPDEPRCRKG